MLEYEITAKSKKGGKAKADANHSEVRFDASAGRDATLPNPAELLLTSLSACILKNVERFSGLLHFDYRMAKVTVKGLRNESPPYMSEIEYTLEVDSDMDEKMLQLLHKNILKFGTITNTLAKASNLKGRIIKMKTNE